MSGISFEDGTTWMVRNWSFGIFMNRLAQDNIDDPDVVQLAKSAIANYGLHFDLLRERNRALADRMFFVLERTTAQVLAEDERAFPELGDDREGRKLLLGQVARLSELLEHVKEQPKAKPK